MKEGSLEAPTRHPLDWKNPAFYDQAATEKELERVFNIKSNEEWKQIMAMADEAREAFGKEKSSKLTFWRPKKDLGESKTGYHGRMGIYEVLNISSDIQKMIVTNGTSEAIQDQAVKEGMATMQMDGLIKCMLGMTTIEEILRVTKE